MNFGWRCFEGSAPTPGVDRAGCPDASDTQLPELDLPRSAGYRASSAASSCAIPGLPTLTGRYLFGDFARPQIMSAVLGTAADRAPRA